MMSIVADSACNADLKNKTTLKLVPLHCDTKNKYFCKKWDFKFYTLKTIF